MTWGTGKSESDAKVASIPDRYPRQLHRDPQVGCPGAYTEGYNPLLRSDFAVPEALVQTDSRLFSQCLMVSLKAPLYLSFSSDRMYCDRSDLTDQFSPLSILVIA
jgi:hypothetical protein